MQTYAKYAPYQFLAYWRELWRDYEQLVGPLCLLSPDAYHLLTGKSHEISRLLRFVSSARQKILVPIALAFLSPHDRYSTTSALHQQYIGGTSAVPWQYISSIAVA